MSFSLFFNNDGKIEKNHVLESNGNNVTCNHFFSTFNAQVTRYNLAKTINGNDVTVIVYLR
jgi:hypothetical protein